MNALECLLRAERKGDKKGIGKIVHDLWIEKGNKYRKINNQDKNRKRRYG